MTLLSNVKTHLLINFFSILWAFGAEIQDWSIEPTFDCGIYQVTGMLTLDKNKNFILILRYGSSSPVSLILLGGPGRDLKLNSWVKAEIYIPQKISGPNRAYVYLQKFMPLVIEEQNIYKINSAKCGQKSMYVGI
ncbi:MAG: hypothetical protein A2504_14120 [Bdellovibrionales bacterium RIFOXYD12_FULL_39_22]|nr:MAG: hypothetical protein A2385_04555 [Bdellovibrionales bacterium RIFOXYB1_FULL_39_21]OFZ43419.1 MAG: hypothetical protein A2485_13070 [Bdellovibrionales bacterium RIFOXYC12_FULL_39_17]OFZ46962.1 MAG: hypothetical protein A2404_00130 [Bdellovibrionales bacterium RIFOXYC1_FULL_39_130]OFZ76159.1 MAG: hypothetical protein A2560_07380 [Bdellovibrionales bacterium RIFOXYD1_FULL_39_84]OFZ94394.1 MAG: hypothetical protein A2504_14120 [Bdellovibrionales bacterium RIFOXYD12_FULL_39_22]HLE10566.1 hy